MNGTVGVLSVGAGDTKLSFDPGNPVERIRAARIVRDMLRRGYALLVEVERDGKTVFTRALDFDESVCEYVIADFDPVAAAAADEQDDGDNEHGQDEPRSAQADGAQPAPKTRGVVKRNVKAEATRAVAVARTAGG